MLTCNSNPVRQLKNLNSRLSRLKLLLVYGCSFGHNVRSLVSDGGRAQCVRACSFTDFVTRIGDL